MSASLAAAQVKGVEGFSESALKNLENLLPLIRHADARLYNSFLNSYAFELGRVGRKQEASNVIKRVLASPLSIAYPGWHETARELKEPNRSFTSVSQPLQQIERKHVEVEPEPIPEPEQEERPADVLPFQKLIEAPALEKPERVSHTQWDDMTGRQRVDFVMTALRTGAISERHHKSVALMTGMIKTGPASKVLDLEDESVMTDILIEWAHMNDPDDLAGIISLLRDCDDRVRRVNLMDAMIRKLFEYTSACGVSEEAWRKKVERRLPNK